MRRQSDLVKPVRGDIIVEMSDGSIYHYKLPGILAMDMVFDEIDYEEIHNMTSADRVRKVMNGMSPKIVIRPGAEGYDLHKMT